MSKPRLDTKDNKCQSDLFLQDGSASIKTIAGNLRDFLQGRGPVVTGSLSQRPFGFLANIHQSHGQMARDCFQDAVLKLLGELAYRRDRRWQGEPGDQLLLLTSRIFRVYPKNITVGRILAEYAYSLLAEHQTDWDSDGFNLHWRTLQTLAALGLPRPPDYWEGHYREERRYTITTFSGLINYRIQDAFQWLLMLATKNPKLSLEAIYASLPALKYRCDIDRLAGYLGELLHRLPKELRQELRELIEENKIPLLEPSVPIEYTDGWEKNLRSFLKDSIPLEEWDSNILKFVEHIQFLGPAGDATALARDKSIEDLTASWKPFESPVFFNHGMFDLIRHFMPLKGLAKIFEKLSPVWKKHFSDPSGLPPKFIQISKVSVELYRQFSAPEKRDDLLREMGKERYESFVEFLVWCFRNLADNRPHFQEITNLLSLENRIKLASAALLEAPNKNWIQMQHAIKKSIGGTDYFHYLNGILVQLDSDINYFDWKIKFKTLKVSTAFYREQLYVTKLESLPQKVVDTFTKLWEFIKKTPIGNDLLIDASAASIFQGDASWRTIEARIRHHLQSDDEYFNYMDFVFDKLGVILLNNKTPLSKSAADSLHSHFFYHSKIPHDKNEVIRKALKILNLNKRIVRDPRKALHKQMDRVSAGQLQ